MGAPISHRLNPAGLIAIIWCSIGLAGIFVVARTYLRITRIRGFGNEDHCIYFAYLMLIVNAVLQTIQIPNLFYIDRVHAGLQAPGASMTWNGDQYIQYEYCILVVFWTILWSVKAGWLAMYWRFFNDLEKYRGRWKAVALFVFATYAGCWLASPLVCHPVSAFFHFGQCKKANDMGTSIISVTYTTVADTITNLMIIWLPLHMLHSAQLAFRQKAGLAIIFSLAAVVIGVAIARAVDLTKATDKDGIIVDVWGVIESTVSVIVGCLPPFMSLFRGRRALPRHNKPAHVIDLPRSTYGGVMTTRSIGGNQKVNAWLNSLPETKSRDSPIDPLHARDEGFVEYFTNEGRHNMKVYENPNRHRIVTIPLPVWSR